MNAGKSGFCAAVGSVRRWTVRCCNKRHPARPATPFYIQHTPSSPYRSQGRSPATRQLVALRSAWSLAEPHRLIYNVNPSVTILSVCWRRRRLQNVQQHAAYASNPRLTSTQRRGRRGMAPVIAEREIMRCDAAFVASDWLREARLKLLMSLDSQYLQHQYPSGAHRLSHTSALVEQENQ